jgi:hypothetical protein
VELGPQTKVAAANRARFLTPVHEQWGPVLLHDAQAGSERGSPKPAYGANLFGGTRQLEPRPGRGFGRGAPSSYPAHTGRQRPSTLPLALEHPFDWIGVVDRRLEVEQLRRSIAILAPGARDAIGHEDALHLLGAQSIRQALRG